MKINNTATGHGWTARTARQWLLGISLSVLLWPSAIAQAQPLPPSPPPSPLHMVAPASGTIANPIANAGTSPIASPIASPALPSPEQLQPQERLELDQLRQEKRLQQLIDQNLSRSPQFQDRIELEVDRAFERTTTLLNVLLVILTAIPLFVALGIWLLRRSVLSEIVADVRAQVEKEVLPELKTQKTTSIQEIESLKVAALTQITESTSTSRTKLDELELQINIAEQEVDSLKAQMTLQMQRMVADAQVVKDQTLQELTGLMPMSLQGSISPEVKPRLGVLTTFLDTLKSTVPQLSFTAADYAKQGYALFFEGRYEDAIALYDKALGLSPDSYEAWLGKGATLLVLQDYDDALTAYDQAIVQRQDSFEAWFGKGAALRKLNRPEEAIASYDQAIALKPDSPLAYYNKGLSSLDAASLAAASSDATSGDTSPWDASRLDMAIAALEQATQLKPDFQKAWIQLSTVLRQQQRYNEADAACSQALQLNPKDADARYGQACCDALQQRPDNALTNLQVAFQANSALKDRASTEPDLSALRDDDRFQTLLANQ